MADYFSPTVVQPLIPLAAMTAAEHLLLTHVFDFERDGDALYFFAEQAMNDMPTIAIDDVRHALDGEDDGVAATFLRERMAETADGDAYLQLHSEIPWEGAFQDIAERSTEIAHVIVTTSYTCTKMRPDAFGGSVTLITANEVLSSGTEQMLCDLLDRAEFGDIGVAPGHGSHVLLRLSEENVRTTVEVIFDTEAPDGVVIEDVTDADIRQAAFDVKAASDLSHEESEAAFKAACRAIHIAAERRQAAR